METTNKKESMKIVPPGKKKCIWMEAGVVSYKLCDNNYDCPTCVYDQGMQLKVARQKEAAQVSRLEPTADNFTQTWVDSMMRLPASQRKCRYMITGEIGRKICPNAYECGNCSFDQMMQERLQAEPFPATTRSETAGFTLVEDAYYHEGHTWARPEYGGRVRVGLDDFAQKLLGRLSQIDIPEVGREVKQGEVGFQVKWDHEMAQVLSPVDGIVSRVNHSLLDHPELIHQSPYQDAWLFIVEPTKLRKNLKGLYYGEEARQFLNDETDRLFAMANEDVRMVADGGESVTDIVSELKPEDRAKILKTFLRT